MAFDMRGELFGNRDELLREQSDRFLESLGLMTEISLVDCLNSQISALQAENTKLRARISELEEQLYGRFDEQADMGQDNDRVE